MKLTGIARRVDKLGRIVIPMEARRELGWEEKTLIEICPFGRYILLRQQGDGGPSLPISQENPITQEVCEILARLSEEDMLLALGVLHRLAGDAISSPAGGE